MSRFRRTLLLAMTLALPGCVTPAPTRPPASTTLAPVDAPLPAPEEFQLDAPAFAPAKVVISVQLPPGYEATGDRQYPVLYVNDGQDMPAVRLRETLQALYRERAIRPVIVVAVHMLPDRMGTYGLSDREHGRSLVAPTKYGRVGSRAHDYSEWVAHTLVPWVDARYRTKPAPDARAVLGWSLGALNAFNLGWQYPEVFGRVGAFSPSFWLSEDTAGPAAVQRTRLAQRLVDGTPPRNGPRLFFAVGTAEETDDRDSDGINDALDDTRDLIEGWSDAGATRKGLRQQGYTINLDHARRPARTDVALYTLEGGRHDQASWARMLPAFLRWAYAVHAPAIDATGTLESWQDFPSRHVAARSIDVWLPPGYADHPTRRYPVLYMHDGQNLFDPSLSHYTRTDWGVDEAMTRLIAEGRVREAIVVGIWNTPRRLEEYMPEQAVATPTLRYSDDMPGIPRERLLSDEYLRFLVEELKPFVDARYRTRPGRDDTSVMGSSMGGLISAYAVARYPDVFGAAACVSTHWPAGDGAVIDWLASHLPDRRTHRFYFDHGTATLDAAYAPYQQRMDAVLRGAGWREGTDFTTRRFEGAEHSERAWRTRVDVPLEFLLGM